MEMRSHEDAIFTMMISVFELLLGHTLFLIYMNTLFIVLSCKFFSSFPLLV